MSASADTLTVHIVIEPSALKVVMDSKFNLCLSRDVSTAITLKPGDELEPEAKKGNVVFSAIENKELATNMAFKWEDKYQVFGTKMFKAGAQVTVDTQTEDTLGGEKTTFDRLGKPTKGGVPQPGNPFYVVNNWKPEGRVGINHFDVTTGKPSSIFVSAPLLLDMTSTLLPIKKFNIFWIGDLTTNSMFDIASTTPFTFDMTKKTEIWLNYSLENKWVMSEEAPKN